MFLRYFCLFVHSVCNRYCVVFFSSCLRLVYSMLPVSLDCPFLLSLRYYLAFISNLYGIFKYRRDTPI